MRCRRWRCPRCGPALRNRLVHLVSQQPPDSMLTLTVDTKAYANPYDAARRLSWALGRLLADIRKWAKPAPVEYLAVWERTKAGWPHLHVLLRGPFIPQALVSRWWNALTKSPVVWFTPLHGSRAGARYVTKYLTKDPDPFAQGRSLRVSRGFLIEPMRPQGKRFCTLGRVRVYEGRVWNWMMDELGALRLVTLDDYGQAASVPWSSLGVHENVIWLRWERQRASVLRYERPPPLPVSVALGPFWADRATTSTPT